MNRKQLLRLWAHIRTHRYALGKKHLTIFDFFLFAVLAAAGLLGLGLLAVLFFIYPFLPQIDNLQNIVAAQSSVILDREGNTLYTIHGEENRKIIPLSVISPSVVHATLAIEDDEFYNHSGIDILAIMKAVCHEVHVCSTPRGGSTLTQQFVKNAFLSSERTYTRKIREILLALELERRYTKDQILEMYLNRIPYGSSIFGVEVAAQTFFGKKAEELSVAEAAILAAIPKAPSYFSPYGNNKYPQINLSAEEILKMNIRSEQQLVNYSTELISKGLLGKTYTYGEEDMVRDIYVKGRTDFVLSRMVELGYISEEESQTAIKEANAKEFQPFREAMLAPHFVTYVREYVENKYGKDQIEKGGFKIMTTIDPNIQKAAEDAIAKHAEDNENRFGATNAAAVALDPDNGQILAMVGSRDYWNDEIDGKVNVALRPRLPGSSFKPIVYAAAFLQGYAPSTVLYDVATKFGEWYEPQNFDGQFRGPVTIRRALAESLNIPAVKAGYFAGIPNVLDLARKMGLRLNQPSDWYGLSLALGAGEVRLLDLTAAYGTFANGGYRVDPVAILKIEDRNSNILEEYKPPEKREMILDPQAAYLINNILSDVEARPEGWWRNNLTLPGQTNGAKTGTSNKEKDDLVMPLDTWTLGYTRRLAGGVWTGNSDGTPLKAAASDIAAPVWHDFMAEATKDTPREEFEKPEGIKWVNVSGRTGKLPSESTPEEDIVSAVFASFSVPREVDNSYKMIEIDKASGKLATEFTPPEAREKKAFFEHHSERPDEPSWEDPVRQWAKENNQDEVAPTEYDDVHTAENKGVKPEIRITSPVPQSTVSPPNVGVWAEINSAAGVAKVEYYFDNRLMSTATLPPFKGNLELGQKLKEGSIHTIKAIVFDELYRTNQSSVEVRVGPDELSPVVAFDYPANGVSLMAGSAFTAEVEARDADGDILKVDFYLDGELKATDHAPPYLWQFVVPDAFGEHTLEAAVYDYAKNEAKTLINITSKPSDGGDLSGSSRLISPAKNASYAAGTRVLIKAYVSETDAETVYVLGKKEGDKPFEIAKAAGSDASAYTFIWSGPSAGRYELQLKITLKDGKMRFSQKVPVVVR
ncbi:transglycosylase domain-containing protein [Candidatus Peregrinibacteria bacterium]|nr:transglycosylase domain-containing protein [Candidatus Peregrinibacteria bacterium]